MMIFQFLAFLFLVYIFLYAPGRFLLRRAKLSYSPSIIVMLSFAVSMALFLFTAYIFAWVRLDWVAFFLAVGLTLMDKAQALKELVLYAKKLRHFPAETLIFVLGVIAMCYLTFRSGVRLNGEYYFYGVNAVDSIYHLALIGNLTQHFPPQHFGLSGVDLRGYHFFYDFLLALFAKYFQFQVTDLYLRFFPVVVSLLYGLSFVSLSSYFKWKRSVLKGLIFIIFFLSNFEFIFNHFVKGELLVHIPEGLAHIFDPSVPLSIAFFIGGYILLSAKKKSFVQILLSSLVIGIIPMLKVYTGFLFFVGMGCRLLINFYNRKFRDDLLIVILASAVACVTYLPTNFGAGGFIFAPFIYLRHLMEGSHFFQNLHYPLQFLIFQEHSNFLRMGIIMGIISLVFFTETLGFRIPATVYYLVKKRKINLKINGNNIFWSATFLTGILIPILFIQSNSVFNIVQFYWIALTLSLSFLAFQIDFFTGFFSRKIVVTVWLVIIFSSLPALVQLVKTYSTSPTIISKDTVRLTDAIRSFVPLGDPVLILIQDKYGVPLYSALSSRSMYLETEGIDFAGLQNISYDREQKIVRILGAEKRCRGSSNPDSGLDVSNLISSAKVKYFITSPSKCFENHKYFKILFKTSGQWLVQTI